MDIKLGDCGGVRGVQAQVRITDYSSHHRQRRAAISILSFAMLALASCEKPTPATTTALSRDRLNAAFLTAFPKGPTQAVATDQSGATPSPGEGYPLTFIPKTLVPLGGDLVVLISEGSNEDACHACTGKLLVSYLRMSGDSFTLAYPSARQLINGNGFGEPPIWRITSTDGGLALEVKTGSLNQGCVSTETSIFELKPEGASIAEESRGAEKCS